MLLSLNFFPLNDPEGINIEASLEASSEGAEVNTMRAKSLQSCPTLCNPMDCSPSASTVHGIFQTILVWVVISSFRGSSRSRDQTHVP